MGNDEPVETNSKYLAIQAEKIEQLKAKGLVRLIAQIIVDATFTEVYEKSNSIPEIQQRRSEQ